MVGELDAGNPHVQFDEGAQETYDIAARLCPTLPEPLASLVSRSHTQLEADHRRACPAPQSPLHVPSVVS